MACTQSVNLQEVVIEIHYLWSQYQWSAASEVKLQVRTSLGCCELSRLNCQSFLKDGQLNPLELQVNQSLAVSRKYVFMQQVGWGEKTQTQMLTGKRIQKELLCVCVVLLCRVPAIWKDFLILGSLKTRICLYKSLLQYLIELYRRLS